MIQNISAAEYSRSYSGRRFIRSTFSLDNNDNHMKRASMMCKGADVKIEDVKSVGTYLI